MKLSAIIVALAFCPVPTTAQDFQRIATEVRALVATQADEEPVAVVSTTAVRCPTANVLIALATLEDQLSLQIYENLHGGDFVAAGRVDAEDPRDYYADTNWVAASFSSPAGVLWGRDYSPNTVFEGITRLLDNTRARINAYSMSFASLTPRLVISGIVNEATNDAWLILSVNGTIVAFPGENEFANAGWPQCALGMLFIGDAFDARGFIPAKYFD